MTERSWTPSDQSAFSFERITPRFCGCRRRRHVPEITRIDELLHLLQSRVIQQKVARASARGRSAVRERRAPPFPRHASRAASRRRRACLPRAPASPGRSASARASRSKPRPPCRPRELVERRRRLGTVGSAPRLASSSASSVSPTQASSRELPDVPRDVRAPVVCRRRPRATGSQLPDLRRRCRGGRERSAGRRPAGLGHEPA